MPTCYIGVTLDPVHPAHIELIKKAHSLGRVIVGIISDRAMSKYRRLPALSWEQRRDLALGLNYVSEVVEQDDWDYAPNIRALKPNYFIHGTNWDNSPKHAKESAVAALSEHGGELIEIPATHGVDSHLLSTAAALQASTPESRRSSLRKSLLSKPLSLFMEAHSPLSALLIENILIGDAEFQGYFDGFWSSSLTDSTLLGKPDIEAVDFTTRLANINNIFEVTSKPLIIDADTGGKNEHFNINIKSMERMGVSAAIIEDKTGLKKNSLFGNDVIQHQDDPESFGIKISEAVSKLQSKDFYLFARIESLILQKGNSDALQRAALYVEAGASGIMIHSREKSPDEVFEFCDKFKTKNPDIPLVVVPTSFNTVKASEFEKRGVNILIYANHMLRASYPAMRAAAISILKHGRTSELEENLISVSEILDLIPGTR